MEMLGKTIGSLGHAGGSGGNSSMKPPRPMPVKRKRGRKGADDRGNNGSGDRENSIDCKTVAGGGGTEDDAELETHIWTERERRKKMRDLFNNLHALLPHLPDKADKSSIVDEAVSYIKTLQQSVEILQQRKLERLRGTATTFNCGSSLAVEPSWEPFVGGKELPPPVGENSEAYSHSYDYKIPTSPMISLADCNYSHFRTWLAGNVVASMCGDDAHISVCSLKKPGLLTTIFYILDKHKLDVISTHISSDQYRCMYMIHARGAGGSSNQIQEASTVEEVFKLAVEEMSLLLSSY
ncbi:transcription factor bHLH95-like [Malania oleifera]|uniref:transcription factor bHLH95-like n=1 Tax=Malania oleifera TaxID=397392 RepID=UPI0025AE57EE|nr:transcription factor bHLH95-like [Malania oleifera]